MEKLLELWQDSMANNHLKKSDKEVNLADEMADVLFVLMCLANQTGIDLTDALEKNLEKKSIRDADRHKNNEKLK